MIKNVNMIMIINGETTFALIVDANYVSSRSEGYHSGCFNKHFQIIHSSPKIKHSRQ